MSITVGKSVARVDAFDKVTGRTKYYEDRMPAGALYIRIKHAEIPVIRMWRTATC